MLDVYWHGEPVDPSLHLISLIDDLSFLYPSRTLSLIHGYGLIRYLPPNQSINPQQCVQ